MLLPFTLLQLRRYHGFVGLHCSCRQSEHDSLIPTELHGEQAMRHLMVVQIFAADQ